MWKHVVVPGPTLSCDPCFSCFCLGWCEKKKIFSLFSICSFLSFMRKRGFVTHHLSLANYDCPIVNYITQCLTLIPTSVFWRSINPIAEWCAMWGEKKKERLGKTSSTIMKQGFFFSPKSSQRQSMSELLTGSGIKCGVCVPGIYWDRSPVRHKFNKFGGIHPIQLNMTLWNLLTER